MKTNAGEIVALLDDLRGAAWLPQHAKDWPGRVFHFTNVTNAAGIIQAGAIRSRERITASGSLSIDSADPDVVANAPWAHSFVRLYFGARTPTQYHMEGIRPVNQRVRHGAHCPVPVFFVFDAASLLTRDECEFTNGNLSSPGAVRGGSAAFLRGLPFKDIYHRGVITGRKPEIVFARCAEVLIPDVLDLTDVVSVVCRTGAERRTLLHLIGGELAALWRQKIRTERPGEHFFQRHWFYVEEVALLNGTLGITLNKPCDLRREATVEFTGGRRAQAVKEGSPALKVDRYRIEGDPGRILVECRIVDSLAFRGYVDGRGTVLAG